MCALERNDPAQSFFFFFFFFPFHHQTIEGGFLSLFDTTCIYPPRIASCTRSATTLSSWFFSPTHPPCVHLWPRQRHLFFSLFLPPPFRLLQWRQSGGGKSPALSVSARPTPPPQTPYSQVIKSFTFRDELFLTPIYRRPSFVSKKIFFSLSTSSPPELLEKNNKEEEEEKIEDKPEEMISRRWGSPPVPSAAGRRLEEGGGDPVVVRDWEADELVLPHGLGQLGAGLERKLDAHVMTDGRADA